MRRDEAARASHGHELEQLERRCGGEKLYTLRKCQGAGLGSNQVSRPEEALRGTGAVTSLAALDCGGQIQERCRFVGLGIGYGDNAEALGNDD